MTVPLRNPGALFIDGRWVELTRAATDPIVNPATEELLAHAPIGGAAEANESISAARQAFDRGPWPIMKAAVRAAYLQALHSALMRRAGEIRALIIAEAGATTAAVHGLQFDTAMAHAQYFIDICTRPVATSLPTEIVPMADHKKMLGAGVAVREPVGVVSAITAFNFPFFLNIGKIFPALAAGNTVVLKPSPLTPFEALVIGEAAAEAELPKGVLNIVTGGAEVGELLTSDARVDLVTFTGSDTIGTIIQAQAARTLKRVLLELGGKSALVVRADANIQAAAMFALVSLTQHAGQSCAATSRLLVHNSVRPIFVETLSTLFKSLRIGNPADPSVKMGPLIRETQRRRVESYVQIGLDEGARLVTGGERPEQPHRGFFVRPTLFDDVRNEWRIAREEVFGPVGVVIGFDSDEEAIAIANDSPYGLAGGVYSNDVGRAFEIALQIRTGRIGINGGSGNMSSHHPFGGIKRSGYGREYGEEGLNEYTYLKSIAFHGG
jgi:aldehyde dehydrogenase (NAD+)